MKYTKSLLLSFLILAMSASALAVSADVTIEDLDGIQRPVDSLCVTGESISEQCKSDRSEYSFDLGNSGNYEFSITDDNYRDKKSTVYVWENSQYVGLTVQEGSNSDGSEDDSSFTVNVDVEDNSGINRPMDSVTVEQDNGDWESTKNDVSSFSLNVPESGDYTFTIEDNRYSYDSSQINLWNDGQDVNLEVEEKNNEDSNEDNTDTSVDNVEVTVTDGSGIRRPMDQITVEEIGGSWEKTRTGVSSFNFDTPDSGNYRFSIDDNRFSFESKTINIWQDGQDVNLEVYSNQNSDDDSEDGSDKDGSQSDDSENENTDYSVSVDIKDDSGVLRPVDRLSIESDSGRTLDTSYDKSQVEFKVESRGNYKLSVEDDEWTERSGSVYVWENNQPVTLRVERKDNGKETPTISLRDPDNKETGVSRNPTYRWRITDFDESSIDDTTLYVEGKDYTGDKPWNQPEHKYDVSDNVGSIENYRSTTTLLDANQEFVWGIEVESDGGLYRSEVFTFTTRSERDRGPKARFSIDNRNPNVDQWVNFDASNSNGDIEEYRWDFGDGDTYTDDDPRVRHRYNFEGDYTVELTVKEYDGDEDTETKTINVRRDDEEETNSAPDVNLVQPSNNQRINLPYTLRWDVSDPENDDVDSTVYVARDRSSQSILDGDYVLIENVGESENLKLYRSDLGNRDYKWRVKAIDENGAITWSGIRSFTVVRDRDRTGNSNLNVIVNNQNGDPIRDARVVVDNENWFSQRTNNNGEASFVVQSGTAEITVSKDGYRTSTRNLRVSPDEDRDVYITLRERSRNNRDEQARLDVHVEDNGYDNLEDAKVTVRNGDREVRYTDSDGDTRFYLAADIYDIEVECNNEREYRSINLNEGERESIDIRFDEDFDSDTCEEEDYDRPDYDNGNNQEGLAITDVSFPNSVCRGGSFSVDMRIENRGGFHELVSITGSGLGSVNTGQSFPLDVSETKSANLRFTNVEGSGQEQFTIRATNHDSARTTRTIDVRDCTGQSPGTGPDYQGTVTGITAEVSPRETVVGKTVQVKGYVDGIRGRSQVTIRANGERKSRISTQPDGYYVSYIRLNQVGDNIIRVSSGDAETESVVEVIPTSSISGVSAPNKVFEGERYEVCADVESQINPKVLLMKNGKVADTAFGKGEVCFEREASEIGENDYNIKTLTYGRESSGSSVTTEVLEVNSEVKNFPDKVATTESEEGLVKVELYNTHNDLRRYNVRLNGVKSTWLSQSEKEVILNKGERETVYFYLTPEEEGNYNPTVEVSSRDGTIFSQEINVYAGGTKNSKKQSFFNRLGNLLSF